MSNAANPTFAKDAWQTPRNARTLRLAMALQNTEIGQRIRKLRGDRPQSAVASALGVSERAYQTWEHGDAKPSYRSLQKLAEYFAVTEGYILEGVDDRPIVEGVPEQLVTIDGKFSELVQQIFDRDDRHRAQMYERLHRIETKLDRLMHMVDAGLFLSPPAATDDEDRRHQERLRDHELPLGEVLAEALTTNPQALEVVRDILRETREHARTGDAPAKRAAGQ